MNSCELVSQPIRFEPGPLDPKEDVWDILLRAVIILGLLLLVYYTLHGQVFAVVFSTSRVRPLYQLMFRPSILWAMMGTLMLFFRTILWIRYRTFPSAEFENAPILTVVIPAYNEGPMVAQSIHSVANALYPRDRLEIIVIDDGSKDDTWQHIQDAAKHYPGLVRPIQLEKNMGKRAALGMGFRLARGEIVGSIDSDSVIERQTLLALVGPFRNPKIGAVAGKVLVLNRARGLIPRMLHVRFILSFDFLRAAQSSYGMVYCCPGALAAYRTDAVHKVLDDWLNQRFMGVPCTYGEDRAITNFILGQGYDTVYQRSAVVHTVVPETYSRLCKMYLRWERSYIREEAHFARLLPKRKFWPRLIAFVDVTLTNLRYPISWVTMGMLAVVFYHDPAIMIRVLLMIGLLTFLNMLYYLRSERSWDFIYGVFYSYYAFFLLPWIFPYALLTVKSKSWMTR